jgi:transposase
MEDNIAMDKTKTGPDQASGAKGQRHTKEFKKQAVARLKESANATALALELGVGRNQLYKWAKDLELNGPYHAFKERGRPQVNAEDELARLRRENARLELENAILKKADAYFARHKP